MSYEQIDFICDSYNPTLFIIVLLMIGLGIKSRGGRDSAKVGGIFLASVVTSYLIVALERKVGAWGYFGMDFSTHTMISIVFASWIWRLAPSTKVLSLVGSTTLIYWGAMVYQKYHSIQDILTTAVITGGVIYLFVFWLYKKI